LNFIHSSCRAILSVRFDAKQQGRVNEERGIIVGFPLRIMLLPYPAILANMDAV
jgi:hypothetical protein